ncbi:hypothetical protein CHCC14814_3809 [Bacillus paralicheniformis]|nr:hypothetical protein CHCC14814_3809 [Bacillus paralicheniformis]
MAALWVSTKKRASSQREVLFYLNPYLENNRTKYVPLLNVLLTDGKI